MWTNVRIAAYLSSAALAGGTLLSIYGFAEFDSATGMLDIKPINVNSLVALVTPIATSCMAAVAAVFKWGRK